MQLDGASADDVNRWIASLRAKLEAILSDAPKPPDNEDFWPREGHCMAASLAAKILDFPPEQFASVALGHGRTAGYKFRQLLLELFDSELLDSYLAQNEIRAKRESLRNNVCFRFYHLARRQRLAEWL